MSDWAARVFWTEATVAEVPGGWGVMLDARQLRSPAKALVAVPTRALAQAVAAEWAAQEGKIAPQTMPLTRAVNSAIDKVAPQRAEVAAMLAEYGGSDLLCYRADGPAALVARQEAAWDPLLDWAEAELGARLLPTRGVMHLAQPPEALAALAAPLMAADAWWLTAVHDLVVISGSLVLGLAVARGHLTPEAAWDISRIDEEWQIEQWGADDDATHQASLKRQDFENAWDMLRLLRP